MPTTSTSSLIIPDFQELILDQLRERGQFNFRAGMDMARKKIGGRLLIVLPLAGVRDRDIPEVEFRTETWPQMTA